MQNRNEIFSQKANRSYVESTMGKEIWIQVSGHRELNGADAGFWATLVDIDNISLLFNDVGWDGQVGTQEPSFVQCGDNIVYHTDCVSVYLGDLGRDLPEEEQDHWLQYNIEPSIKLSDVAFKRDFLNIPAESTMSDIQFKHAYDALHERWRQQFDWDLLLPLSEDDEYNIKLLRIPVTGSQDEFDHQVLSLVKSIIDSLNEKQIFKQLTNTENLAGGISKLERWLSERNVQDSKLHIKFLRNLQELRSTGTGHRKGKGYEKIKKEFGIQDDLRASFSDILSSATSFVNFMGDSAEILKK